MGWFKDQLWKQANKPVPTTAPLLRLDVEFGDEYNAILGEKVLAANAVVVERTGRKVDAIVRRPAEATSLPDDAKRLSQPLLDARLDFANSTLQPPLAEVDQSDDLMCWHRKGLSKGYMPSAAEARSIRTSPVKFLPRGFHELSTDEGPDPLGDSKQSRLQWVDVPEIALWPWPTWLYLTSILGLFISGDFGLAGNDRWWSWWTVIFAVAAVASALLMALPLEWPGSAKRFMWPFLGIAGTYGATLLVARAAPGPVNLKVFWISVAICRRRSNSGRFRRSKSERCVGSLTGLLVGGLTDAGQGVDAAVT